MKTQFFLSLAVLAYLVAPALGATSRTTLKACSEVDADAVAGTICKTSEGFQFKRYLNPENNNLGWEDIGAEGRGGIGGKIWYDATANEVNAQEAMNFCADAKLDLPSLNDTVIGIQHGLKEVLKDAADQRYWSSTNSQSRPISAFKLGAQEHLAFSGPTQTSFYTYPYQELMLLTRELNVRCVGTSGVNH